MSMTYDDWVNQLPVAKEDNYLRLLQVGQHGKPAWPSFDGAMPNSPLPHGVERVIPDVQHPSLEHTLNHLFVFRPYPYWVGRIDAIFNSVPHHQRYSIILTGTPGIGKTTFLAFFMIYLLRAQKDFIVFRDGIFHVTNNNRVLVTKELPNLLLPGMPLDMKLFIDVESPPPTDIQSMFSPSRFCLIQASSPRKDNYKWLEKQKRGQLLVLDPYTDEEIVEYLEALATPEQQAQVPLNVAVASFGPNLRAVWLVLDQGVAAATASLRSAIDKLAPISGIQQLLKGNREEKLTHSVIKTVNVAGPPLPSDPRYTKLDATRDFIANNTVWRLIFVRLRKDKRNKIVDLVCDLSYHGESASYASLLFEGMAHDRLSDGGDFELRELTRTTDPSKPTRFAVDASSVMTLHIKVNRQSVYASSTPAADTLVPQTYYIPAATNNPTFDAFLFTTSTFAVAFQMTLAATHSLKKSGLALLRQRIKSAEVKHFVFVIPKGRSFSIADPTLGKPKHLLASQMSYWVLEIPLSPDYETALEDMIEAWDADPLLQRVEMEDLVNVPTDVEMEVDD